MNNNKKKITTVVLLLAFLAVAVTGGTLAYFTDTKEATNTFTIGDVKIQLVEEFNASAAQLIPGEKNHIDKKVKIENTGTNDAFVWYEYLIPTYLDDMTDPAKKVVLINNSNPADWTYNANITGKVSAGFVGTEVVGGVTYNKYVALYNSEIASGSSTSVGMNYVYLNSKVDYDTSTGKYTLDGNPINYDFSNNVNIIVRAYAIQADGLDDIVGSSDGVNVFDGYVIYNS